MDFGAGQTLGAYDGLCRVLETLDDPIKGLPFSRYGYGKGFTIFGFDFTPSDTSGGALTPIKHGNLNLNMRLKTPLPNAVNVIAYVVYDSTVSINNNRQAIFDFSA